ncbi:LXG domain-containing protein [Bacillus sp. E(2018)]|uniref:ribonuclease YeeF family protein n=1 Tax=Bacillus sp. E(2018) TaxID=2502239 RepID=UPI0010F71861|nr:LXG domain-containing protein [Bacillus sp. E(2018)]
MIALDAQSLDTWVDSLRKYLKNQLNEMKELTSKVNELASLDSALTGEGGDAIKLFYRESHYPLLLFYETTVTQILTFLDMYQSEERAFDSSGSAYVNTSFLDHDLTTVLQKLRTDIVNLTDEINQTSDTVSDIVALPNISDSQVINGINKGIDQEKKTSENLNRFDQQQVQGISALLGDVSLLTNYIESLTNAVSSSKFSMTEYNSGDFKKKDWYKDLHATLLIRAEELLSVEQSDELKNRKYSDVAHSILEYFSKIKDSMDWGDNLFVVSRMAVAGYYTVLSRQVTIHYPNGKPSLADRFKRNYTFTVRAKDSWKASSGYKNPVASMINKMQKGSLPTNPLARKAAEFARGYSNPASFLKHITGFTKNKTAAETLAKQIGVSSERAKFGVKDVASNVAKAKGLSRVARGIPIVGNGITIVSNLSEFTDPNNADKSFENKAGRFVTGTFVDITATAVGAKTGAMIGSFGGPVGIVVGGAVGAVVGAAISSKYGDSIKDAGGKMAESAVKFGKNVTDKAGKAFKSIGSWFK